MRVKNTNGLGGTDGAEGFCVLCGGKKLPATDSADLKDYVCFSCKKPDNSAPAGAKVLPLFSDRPTGAGLPPQPDVVAVLTQLLEDAKVGRITQLGMVCFTPAGQYMSGTWGQGTYTGMVGGLEDLKHKVIRNYLLHSELGPQSGDKG